MAALTWVRVEASLASNHKVLTLLAEKGGDHALCVYIFALGYCGQQGTDGFIPTTALGIIHGRARDAQLLVEVGLWHEMRGGYEVHDWLEYQPSSEENRIRADKARKAAESRWSKQQKPALRAVNS